MLRCMLIFALAVLTMAGALSAAEDEALLGRESVTTAKERLVNKAADPQRVNDCKVPTESRDADDQRSSDCPHLDRRGASKSERSGD